MIWIAKFVHISAISLWAAALLALPTILLQARRVSEGDRERLQRFVRFLFVGLASPAAFVAIGSGTALIFLQGTFVEWFSVKLAFVGLLVISHVLTGLTLVKTFEPEGRFGRVLAAVLSVGNVTAISGVLYFVLAKPRIDLTGFGGAFFQPGALREFLEPFIYAVTP